MFFLLQNLNVIEFVLVFGGLIQQKISNREDTSYGEKTFHYCNPSAYGLVLSSRPVIFQGGREGESLEEREWVKQGKKFKQ